MAIGNGAHLSQCRAYRYVLWRSWGSTLRHVAFIGLNPSTADENLDDPTIRRCVGFAKQWGYDGLYMLNLFAYRATDPKTLVTLTDEIRNGPDNDMLLQCYVEASALTVAAWGAFPLADERWREMRKFLCCEMYCLGKNANGSPKHPLYLAKDTAIVPFA